MKPILCKMFNQKYFNQKDFYHYHLVLQIKMFCGIFLLDCCSCLLFSFPEPNPKRLVLFPLIEMAPFKKGLLSLTKVFSVFSSLLDENNDCWLIPLDT